MRNRLKTSISLLAASLVLMLTALPAAAQAEAKPDPLAPLTRFVGSWSGTASGQSGDGTVARTYSPSMRGRYLQETNVSRYPAREANKADEVHEHLSMFSYDKARKLIVLRQFHVEGFVNTYRQVSPPDTLPLVFESESFENFSNAWKARETYEFSGDDEFVETFELAPPGKPYEVYSRNRLKRQPK
jgi:hypothetical protein